MTPPFCEKNEKQKHENKKKAKTRKKRKQEKSENKKKAKTRKKRKQETEL